MGSIALIGLPRQPLLLVKKLPADTGDARDVVSVGRTSRGGHGYPPSILAWKSHGQISLVGCSPWGDKELDTTEAT